MAGESIWMHARTIERPPYNPREVAVQDRSVFGSVCCDEDPR